MSSFPGWVMGSRTSFSVSQPEAWTFCKMNALNPLRFTSHQKNWEKCKISTNSTNPLLVHAQQRKNVRPHKELQPILAAHRQSLLLWLIHHYEQLSTPAESRKVWKSGGSVVIGGLNLPPTLLVGIYGLLICQNLANPPAPPPTHTHFRHPCFSWKSFSPPYCFYDTLGFSLFSCQKRVVQFTLLEFGNSISNSNSICFLLRKKYLESRI